MEQSEGEQQGVGTGAASVESHTQTEPEVDSDHQCGTASYVLPEKEHKLLLQLDQEAPKRRGKWSSIHDKLKACGVEVKASTRRSICSYDRKQRKMRELFSVSEQHLKCHGVIEDLKKQVLKQAQEMKDLTGSVEQWRLKVQVAEEERDREKQTAMEVAKLRETESDRNKKKMEQLQTQLKMKIKKINYLEERVKQAEAQVKQADEQVKLADAQVRKLLDDGDDMEVD